MRASMIGLLGLALADATPRRDTVDESTWREGDFVSAANLVLWLESKEVTVYQGTKEVAKAMVDLGSIDQTSTFVELDSFRSSGGR